MRTTSDVVQFDCVSKRYRLRESRTLKEFLPGLLRRDSQGEDFFALDDLSFSLGRGETLGIVGPNGSGKSTTLKLIAGVSMPTKGSVFISGKVAPLIELGAGFHPDLTGRENVFLNGCILGLSNQEIRSSLPQIVEFAELERFMDTPVKRYSSGMYLRLAFSVAVHSNPDILLVDEALAVGDLAFREKCLERMREFQRQGVSIILVSHSLDLIEEFCHEALLLIRGRKVAEGSSEQVISAYRSLTETHSSPVEVHVGS